MTRLLALLLLLAASTPALGHTRSHSYALWSISGLEARVELRVSKRDLTLFEPGGPRDAMLRTITVEPCAALPESFAERSPTEATRVFTWRLRCDAPPGAIRSDFLVDRLAGHAHFVTVQRDGAFFTEGVLDETSRVLHLPEAGADGETRDAHVLPFVRLGFEHILSGADHLVFLLVLVLAVRRLRSVALAVTGFTLGHSLTLGLAVLGLARPEAAAVEALIGASIALLAIENVWLSEGRGRLLPTLAVVGVLSGLVYSPIDPRVFLGAALFTGCYFALLHRAERPERWRFAVAALFGLVHGFGFGGALSEMTLPDDRLLASLAGFNIGVELGQLALLLPLWPLIAWASRGELGHARVTRWGSAVAMALAAFWWVSRTMA